MNGFFTILSLALSAFFSASEIAFLSASRIGIELKKQSGTAKGKMLSRFYDRPNQYLGVMLIGNNIALVAFTILFDDILGLLWAEGNPNPILQLIVATLLSTLIVLLFGEFMPKTIARVFADKFMNIMAYPLQFFHILLGIPAYLTTKLSNFILKYIFRIPVTMEDKVFTKLDLEDFVDDKMKGQEDELETDMFKNALHLTSIKIRECMIPRTEMIHIDINANYEDYLQLFNKTHLSRIIVTDGDPDNIVGYVHHLQFLFEPTDIKDVIRPLPFVPEAMNAQDLLIKFREDNSSIACVVDEYGGVSGIITMEDLLEEIFGEIEDEHDQGENVELKLNEHEYLLSGRLEIDYLNEKYEDINIPEGEYTTLSGYLIMTSENIPKTSEVITIGNYKFILVQVSETKIDTIRLVILES